MSTSELRTWCFGTGSAEGVQVAVWLRLAILPSLLPLVYADREPDAAKNLRALLAQALVSLLMSTAVYTSVPFQQPGRWD